MRPTNEPTAPALGEDVSAIQGGAAYLTDIERRLAPYVERAEPRQRAMAYLRGLLSPAERKNSWQLADVSGDTTPYGLQHLLRRALGDPEAVRDELRRYVLQHLGDAEAVLVLDDTGFLKKGRHSAGVARPYRGTAGKVENCQIGVLLGDASRLGHTLLDRELYVPQEWTNDRERCRQAGIPEDRRLATKPPLARQRLARALAAGTPATWVTGDSVYGDDRRLRIWLEAQPQAYVLAVSGKAYVWLARQQRQVKTILASLPAEGGTRLSAGDGAKGPRWYDWRWRPLAAPLDPAWGRWLLVRRSVSTPTALTAYVVFAPRETRLEEVVQVAGTRWTIESDFEAAKGEVGLDQYEVRSWTGWDSPYHAGPVGVGPVDRHADGNDRGGGIEKKSVASSGGHPSGGGQGQPGALLPLSVPEIRRVVWRLVLVVPRTAHQILAWSRWRRWHQTWAKYYHYKRCGASTWIVAA